MHELHQAVTFTHCIATGLAHAIPWKLVVAPLALVVGGVFVGARRVKKGK
jgi:hypothetical protein